VKSISEYPSIPQSPPLGFSAKLSLGLWALIPILFPIYLSDPGGPQISTAVVILAGIVALAARCRVPASSFPVMKPYYWFLWYVCMVSIVWAALSENPRLLISPVFYLFNGFAMIVCLWLYGRAGTRFLKLTQHAFAIAALSQIVLLFLGGPTTARESVYFDNPNQLGYFALTSAAVVLMLAERLSTPTWYRGAVLGLCFFLVMVSTSFAAIGGFALLMILALKRHPAMLILMALAFVALLSVWDADLFLSRRIEYETEEMEGVSFMASRGYDRIFNHPEHVFFGAGEGNYKLYESVIGSHEIHSSYGTLLFCYGIVGSVLFALFLISLARAAGLRYAQYLLPVLLYGAAHQGLRSTMLWVFMALLCCVGDSLKAVEPIRCAHLSTRSPGRGFLRNRAAPAAITFVLVGLFGCAGTEMVGPVPIEGSPPQSQGDVDVTSFGARGDDQADDTEAFAAALRAIPAAGGTIHIPAGTYLFTATPRSSIGRGIDLFHRTNITLAGEGMERTILRMAPGVSYKGDTHIILIELSSGITIRDLMIDGNRHQVSYGDEQSHGVEVRGSSNLRFERVLFTGMHGDGIRLVGLLKPITWVDQIQVEECRFAYNGRSGIAVQRAVRGLRVSGSTFTRIMDQSIDMEPSSAAAEENLAPHDIEITNNAFFDTASLALTITGKGGPAHDVLVADNEFDGTGIFVFNAQDVRIENNVIRSGSGRAWAPIEIRKRSERIWIIDNEIDSSATTGKSAIILTFHTSAAPREVYVIGNVIRSGVYDGIHARDSEGLQIKNNTISGQGGSGIHIQDINPSTPLDDFLVEGNNLFGYEVGIRFSSRGDPTRGVCIRENVFDTISTNFVSDGPIFLGCLGQSGGEEN
jgi:hypothetical protein